MDSSVAPIVFIREVQPNWSFSEAIQWWKSLNTDEREEFRADVQGYYEGLTD